jgi:peptidoglycan/LPS O-acetylase OafA/YrhL
MTPDRDHQNNSFDLVRIAASFGVLVSHSWSLTARGPEPHVTLGSGDTLSLGTICVLIFFAISGCLITASALRTDLRRFGLARALRIYPGYFAVVFLVALVVGPWFTRLTLRRYFGEPELYDYLAHALFFRPFVGLRGVFADNPYPLAVNGSLWTLPLEVGMYGLVALTAAAQLLRTRARSITTYIALAATMIVSLAWMPASSKWMLPALAFVLGALCHLTNARGRALAFGAVIGGVASFVPAHAISAASFVILISALTLWIGRGRAPVLRPSRDLSYGVYLYAFPLQQITASFGVRDPWLMILLVTAPCFALAWLSWQYVERPALALKQRLGSALARPRRDPSCAPEVRAEVARPQSW